MIQSPYVIRGRRFLTRDEYEAGLRDVEKIDSLRERIDLEDPETASRVYQQLIGFPDMFESYLGDEFLHQLQQCASGGAAGEWLAWNEPREVLPLDQDIWGRKRKPGKRVRPGKEIYKGQEKESISSKKNSSGEKPENPSVHTSSKKRKKKTSASGKKRWKTVLFLPICIVLTCIILHEAGYSIYYQVASYLSKKKLDHLVSCILEPVEGYIPISERVTESGEGSPPEDMSGQNQEVLYKYSALYERNEDMVGWISLEGTVINYPVMQTRQEEEYYLKRDFDKENDINGLPFMDARSNILSKENNWIIYGHNMKNGSMFSALLKYKNKEFFDSHRTFQFDTIYEEGEYEIAAVFLTQVGYLGDEAFRYYRFSDLSKQEQFEQYSSGIRTLSLYETGIELQYGDQLVTLSTCDRSIEDGRFVVVGRRILD